MIIGRSQDFKNKVLNNYKSCRTVKELASACDISLSAFKRQFSAEFGEAPAEWMQKQLLGEIKYKLSVTDLPLGTIANELEFSSLAHFSRFCKRCLGCSPKELRQQIKGG
jgi:AraC-like DNA-binding protein